MFYGHFCAHNRLNVPNDLRTLRSEVEDETTFATSGPTKAPFYILKSIIKYAIYRKPDKARISGKYFGQGWGRVCWKVREYEYEYVQVLLVQVQVKKYFFYQCTEVRVGFEHKYICQQRLLKYTNLPNI